MRGGTPCEELGRTFQQVGKLLFTLHYLYQAFQKLLSSGRRWVFSLAVCNLWWKNTEMTAKTSHFYSNLLCQYFRICQFSSVVSDSLRPHKLRYARPPCPSTTSGVYSNSCPLSRWCHPTISSFVVPFFSCLQPFSTSGSFQMSQLFTSGGHNSGVQLQHQSFQWTLRTDFL